MADDDYSPPKAPPAPKKRIADPAKAKDIRSTFAKPTFGESMSGIDLASTTGPIANQRQVEREVGDETKRRYTKQRALAKQSDRIMSKPYRLTGGRR